MATLTQKATAAEFDIAVQVKRINMDLDEFVRSVRIAAPLVVKKVAARVLGRIIKRTPVDTGRARSGWAVAAQFLKIPLSTFGKKTIQPKAVAEGVKAGRVEEQKTEASYSITMANGVRYTPFLEVGHSRQAPRGMVRISLEEERQTLFRELGQIKTKGTK